MTGSRSKAPQSQGVPVDVVGKDPSSLAALARTLLADGSFSAADDVLCAARKAYPDDASLAVESAKLATAMADWQAAAARWEHVLSIDGEGTSAIAFVRLAQAHRLQGDLTQAIEVSRKGLNLYPRAPGLHVELARALIRLEDWRAANEVLLNALATRSVRNSPSLHALKAKVMRVTGDIDGAEKALQHAFQMCDEAISDHRAILEENVEIAVVREDWGEAQSRWAKLVQVHGAGVPVKQFIRMSQILGTRFGPDCTEAVLKQGMEIHGADLALLEAHARTASARGAWREARQRWDAVLAAAEGDEKAGAFAGIAQVHRDAGDLASAERTLKEARDRFPSDVRLLAQAAVLENYRSPATQPNLPAPGSQHPSAEVVVCVYNALDETRACLEALSSRTQSPFRMTVVDDASEAHVRAFLKDFVDRDPTRRLLVNKENLGYTKSANIGLRQARADWVVLLNSDAVVTEGWLEGLLACASSDCAVRAVGPLSNSATFQSMPAMLGYRDEEGKPEDWDDMANKIRDLSLRACPKVPMLNGFCLMLHRPTLEEVGYLDEESFPRGYGEENDLCLRLLMAGYKLAIADWVYVYHKRSASFSHETRTQLTANAVNKLRSMWPGYSYQYIGQLVRDLPALDYLRTRTS